MKKLLFVNSCVRGEASRTQELCRFYIDGFIKSRKEHGLEWETEEVTAAIIGSLKPLDRAELELREKLLSKGDFSHGMFNQAKQIIEADHIVIGAPYWDLQFPAILKTYLERCSVTGLTFVYDENGVPHGKCRAHSLTYITTSGGPIDDMNFGYDYICGLCGLFGIDETHFVSAESLDIVGSNVPEIMEEAKVKITEILKQMEGRQSE